MLVFENILWSTRGYSWGFRRLLSPVTINVDSLVIYNAVFNSDEYITENGVEDSVIIGGDTYRFCAFKYRDTAGRRDISGRVIEHEVVFFDEYCVTNELKSRLDLLDRIYDVIYNDNIDKYVVNGFLAVDSIVF